jgi:hypothetical protein
MRPMLHSTLTPPSPSLKVARKTYLHLQPSFRIRLLHKLPHSRRLRVRVLPQLARRRYSCRHHDRCLVLDLSLHNHSRHLLLVERTSISTAIQCKKRKSELETKERKKLVYWSEYHTCQSKWHCHRNMNHLVPTMQNHMQCVCCCMISSFAPTSGIYHAGMRAP